MAERGQRTTLRFGSVSAEVNLLKTSGKPKSAAHETRRMAVSAEEIAAAERAAAEAMPVADPLGGDDFLPPTREPGRDDFAGASFAIAEEPEEFDVPDPGRPYDPAIDHLADPRSGPAIAAPELPDRLPPELARPLTPTEADALDHGDAPPLTREDVAEHVQRPYPPREYVATVTRVEQGVHTETGDWIDLTARLEEIDRLTKVDGLEVIATIATNAIPRERVRDAHYIAGVDPEQFKVLALLWRALRATDRAAAVRWTKRTAQTLGLLVARGWDPAGANPRGGEPACLVLLEVEWQENMRKPTSRVTGPIRAEVEPGEITAAAELVDAFAGPPARLNDLRDTRLAARAELLQLARDGKLKEYRPPAEPMPETVAEEAPDLAAALAASSAWVREHVPA